MSNDIHHVRANGLDVAYLEDGEGPLVLLLHGFPDTAHSWDHARPRIAARGFRVVSPWLRGYAPTAIPDRDADLDTLSRDTLALIEALGETSAIIVGHDWGAATAYMVAAVAPDRVKQLIVIGIPHLATIKPSLARAWKVRHFVAFKLPGAARRFARDHFAALPALYKRWSPAWSPAPEEFAAVRAAFANPASLDAALGYYRQLRFRAPLSLRTKITVPTVAFAGLDDPIVSPAEFTAAEHMFTAGYTVESMRGGHFMHREHPEEFAAKLLPHLLPRNLRS
jgi:pimeloyl-ACP methyl ester carboxylesterase